VLFDEIWDYAKDVRNTSALPAIADEVDRHRVELVSAMGSGDRVEWTPLLASFAAR